MNEFALAFGALGFCVGLIVRGWIDPETRRLRRQVNALVDRLNRYDEDLQDARRKLETTR